MIMLADQPEIDPSAIDRVVAEARRTDAPIARPIYDGVPGHPVLFARSLFPELARLAGDEGARSILVRYSADVLDVRLEMPPPRDVDTPEDYAKVIRGGRYQAESVG